LLLPPATNPWYEISSSFFESGTRPSVEVDDDGNLYVAYHTISERFTPIKNSVAIMKSTDEGESFSEPIRLDNTAIVFTSNSQRIATSADDIDVTWQESS